jgi:hypothetical protein
VREQLNLEVFCLVCPDFDQLPLLRLQSAASSIAGDLRWVAATDIHSAADLPIEKIYTATNEFGGFTWYDGVAHWIEEQIGRIGHSLAGLEQWNGRVGGVLLRVVTNGPAFWFKAVGDFNTREFEIAQMLAGKHPQYFPRVVAAQPAWNALLLEHINGTELHECPNIEEWKSATIALADVQMDWMGSDDRLLRAGAADLRPETIAAGIPTFLDHVAEAMSRQTKITPAPLTRTDVEDLRPGLLRLTDQTDSLGLGAGLANADFSPHNTLWTSTGPRFIDWAEACVSLPLIAGEYLWNRMAIECPERIAWQSTLRETYLHRWAERYEMETIARAAEILPTFAVLAVAMFFHKRECHGPSAYDVYLRSLARRLQKEIRKTDGAAAVVVRDERFAESLR